MFLIIDTHRSSPSLPQLAHPMRQAARSGAGSSVFTASCPAHPHVLRPTGLSLMLCPGEGQGLLFQLLLMVRCKASSFILRPRGHLSCSLQVARGGGLIFLTHNTTWHVGERKGLFYSHIHSKGSLAPLPIPTIRQLQCGPLARFRA